MTLIERLRQMKVQDKSHDEELFLIARDVLMGKEEIPLAECRIVRLDDRQFIDSVFSVDPIVYIDIHDPEKTSYVHDSILAHNRQARALIVNCDVIQSDFLLDSHNRSVLFGKDFRKFEKGCFIPHRPLTHIFVHPDNVNFVSIDDVLYTHDMKCLISYARGKKEEKFTVPETVEEIAPYAFYYCENLKEIDIHGNPKIYENSFSADSPLKVERV